MLSYLRIRLVAIGLQQLVHSLNLRFGTVILNGPRYLKLATSPSLGPQELVFKSEM